MSDLFSDLAEQLGLDPAGSEGQGRLRVPMRDDVRMEVIALAMLVAAGHPVRLIGSYVERLDFRFRGARAIARRRARHAADIAA